MNVDSAAFLVPALLMGVFGGAHCVVMCGSISSVLCAGRPGASRTTGRLSLAYNVGRIAGYSLLGLAAGALGSLRFGVPVDALRFGLRALAATCLLTVGLHLVGLPSFVKTLESAGAPIWRRVAPIAERLVPLRSSWHALAAGGLWALMPCGLLYGALALAATASSPARGAATMAAFGLGTLPTMLAVGLVARKVVQAFARGAVRRLAGATVLAFGVWSTAGLVQQIGHGALSPSAHACCPRR